MAEELQDQPQAASTAEVITPATLGKRKTVGVAPEEKAVGGIGAFLKRINESAFLSVPLQERVLFARHLSVGIKAGMSMQDSLKLIQVQTKSKSFKKILDVLIGDTANGMFLSASMEKYAGIFGQLFVNIVRVGEQSGTLTENLSYL